MLLARNWNVPRAFALLLEAISTRRLLRPERLSPQQAKKGTKTAQVYRRGFTKQGHPVIYIRFKSNIHLHAFTYIRMNTRELPNWVAI